MVVAWRHRQGWQKIVFCNDGRIVDDKGRGWAWQWEEYGRENRGMIWQSGYRIACIAVLWSRIESHTCHLRIGVLTYPWNTLRYQFLMRISPLHQQNVKWFGSHNSTTQLFWKPTPMLPEAPRSSRTGWMQNDVLLRCSKMCFQVLLNAPQVAEQNTRIFYRVWSHLQNAIKSCL